MYSMRKLLLAALLTLGALTGVACGSSDSDELSLVAYSTPKEAY
jgi:hypothetical protein